MQAVMAAAAAAYAGASIEQVTPATIGALPDQITGHIWIEDADGRRLTEPGRLSLRRVAPGQWSNVGALHAGVIETGIAAWLVCEFQHVLHRFEVGADGLILDSRYFATGGAMNITSLQFGPGDS